MTFPEYRGRRVVVTGCSSGVGFAAAVALVDLGAEVIGLSRRQPTVPIASFIRLDLTSVESIERAASSVEGPIDALFNCAGAPPTLPSIELVTVNFLGTRLLTERLLPRMPPGSAVASVASSVAHGWRDAPDRLLDFVATESLEAGVEWYLENEGMAGHGYPFSKQALLVWTMQQAAASVPRGIRFNATSPGAVQTPLLEVSERAFPAEMMSATLQPSGRTSTPEEQVQPLLFLNSDGASYVNGAELVVDGGYAAARALTRTLP